MFRRKKPRPYQEPGRIILTKVQIGQSPLAVALEWEEEQLNPYWSNGEDLFRREGKSFIHVPTYRLDDYMGKET